MLLCLSCMTWCEGSLCGWCRSCLEEVSPCRLPSGIEVTPAFAHVGVARTLVHRLKYDGLSTAGEVFAAALAARIPPGARALVPVPRSTLRRMRYGIDPAMTLAELLRRRTGLEIAPVLRPPLWWPAHAGSRRKTRQTPGFEVVGSIPAGGLLVDDVLTTGATLTGAANVSGIGLAVTATRAGRDLSG